MAPLVISFATGFPDHGSPRYYSPARAGPHPPGGPRHSHRPPAVSMTGSWAIAVPEHHRIRPPPGNRSGTTIGEPPRPPDTPATQSGSYGPATAPHSNRQPRADGHHAVQAQPDVTRRRPAPARPPQPAARRCAIRYQQVRPPRAQVVDSVDTTRKELELPAAGNHPPGSTPIARGTHRSAWDTLGWNLPTLEPCGRLAASP